MAFKLSRVLTGRAGGEGSAHVSCMEGSGHPQPEARINLKAPKGFRSWFGVGSFPVGILVSCFTPTSHREPRLACPSCESVDPKPKSLESFEKHSARERGVGTSAGGGGGVALRVKSTVLDYTPRFPKLSLPQAEGT